MLNHPVTGLTNASEWQHQDLLTEAEHERQVRQCPEPVRKPLWRALIGGIHLEQKVEQLRGMAHLALARIGRLPS